MRDKNMTFKLSLNNMTSCKRYKCYQASFMLSDFIVSRRYILFTELLVKIHEQTRTKSNIDTKFILQLNYPYSGVGNMKMAKMHVCNFQIMKLCC